MNLLITCCISDTYQLIINIKGRKTLMTWDILNIIGTIAFAISGAIVAMEEDYDILGVLVLGFTTAFGGGTIRNILIGDRKSTRLNSSHVAISYAVFCLKKKILKHT